MVYTAIDMILITFLKNLQTLFDGMRGVFRNFYSSKYCVNAFTLFYDIWIHMCPFIYLPLTFLINCTNIFLQKTNESKRNNYEHYGTINLSNTCFTMCISVYHQMLQSGKSNVYLNSIP